MKKFIPGIVFIVFCYSGWSQGVLKVQEATFDFGQIKEENGPSERTFELINTGNKPVIISSVEAECGCTTPNWTTDPIQAGDTGYIMARYNPLNRPGPFKKKLTVSSNASNTTLLLYIEGEVLPKPKSIEEQLPVSMGAMRIQYKHLNFGKVTTEKPVTKTFEIYNQGDSTLFLEKDQKGVPPFITVKMEPEKLPGKEAGLLVVTLDPAQVPLGYLNNGVSINTNDLEEPGKELNIVGTIEEYFPPMTEAQLANAPRLAFSTTNYDFGQVQDGEVLVTKFEITNTGKDPLNIREIKSNCDCVKSDLDLYDLNSGETGTISVWFHTSDRKGRQYKTISVFSNDPTRPTQMISIRAEVK